MTIQNSEPVTQCVQRTSIGKIDSPDGVREKLVEVILALEAAKKPSDSWTSLSTYVLGYRVEFHRAGSP